MSAFQLFWWMAAIVTIAACLRWGDRSARLGAISLAISYLATLALNQWKHGNLLVGIAAVDLVYGLFLFGLAVAVQRWWVLLATSNQLLIVAAHVATYTDPTVLSSADITSRWIFGVLVLLATALAPIESRLASARLAVRQQAA